MNILIALDKFKESMTASRACSIVAEEVLKIQPRPQVAQVPVTDGGDGFSSILTSSMNGRIKEISVTGPLGNKVMAGVGLVSLDRLPQTVIELLQIPQTGTLAIIEMAQSSGICLVSPQERDVWKTTSHGTGELIREARKLGVKAILLGIGGSATSDLGLGALQALGLKAKSSNNQSLAKVRPDQWHQIEGFNLVEIERETMPPIRIACDVSNPLFGPNGAAAIYGPQKGLKEPDLPRIEAEGERIAALLCQYTDTPESSFNVAGAGAAGGIGWGLMQLFNVSFIPGYDLVIRWFDLERKLYEADAIITGEGRFDLSSLQGKGPGSLVKEAIDRGKPVTVFGGQIDSEVKNVLEKQKTTEINLIPIKPDHYSLERAIKEGEMLLRRAVRDHFC